MCLSDIPSEKEHSPVDAKSIRWSAMNALARREHSRQELQQKLASRFPEQCDLISGVLDHLETQQLLSDRRFAQAYCAMRARKAYGPVRIAQELKGRGVSADLVQETTLSAEVDWFQLALEGLRKKFHGPLLDGKTKAKCGRYLQYRGFDFEQIQYAIDRWSQHQFDGGDCLGDLDT